MSKLHGLLSKTPAKNVQVEVLDEPQPQCERLSIPPYGHRTKWKPDEFGDGGAFPEIHIPQYPLGMGLKKLSGRGVVQTLSAGSSNKIVHSRFKDLLPRNCEPVLRPNEEEIVEVTARTKQALERLVDGKVKAAMPVQYAPRQPSAQFIRYKGASSGDGVQRIIRMVSAQKDPMEPPKFKINTKIPRGPPSPPVPVLHSPTRKVTMREQQEWKVPPCISNWKNPKGYTIPLDKRLAADGRGLQSVHINEGFANLAEALYVADREAREAIELRSQVERKLAQKEKDKKEEELKRLADQARKMRRDRDDRDEDVVDEVAEREEIRRERQKERQRQRAIQRAAPDKRTKLMRERERDITESIALGMPNRGGGGAGTVGGEFDTRLMDMSKGLDSGFGADDAYGVYDRPWREENSIAQTIYRPSKNIDDDDIEKIANAKQFVGHSKDSGPVEFEKAEVKEEKKRKEPVEEEDDDPFGLGQFFEQVKKTNEPSKKKTKRA